MSVEIVFEPHATTVDNEAKVASGWNNCELSVLGLEQAKELGKRREGDHFAAIFSSDLLRSYETAQLAFDNKFPILKDARLRECNYGDLTLHPSAEVEAEKPKHIAVSFPNGESYNEAMVRMKEFLADLLRDYDGKRVLIIGHRATQYGLEHWIKHLPLEEVIPAAWKWRPGWEYTLEKLA